MTAQAFIFETRRGRGNMHNNGLAPSTEVSRVGRRRDWCTCLRCEMILTDCESLVLPGEATSRALIPSTTAT